MNEKIADTTDALAAIVARAHGLLSSPQPGLATWNEALDRARNDLLSVLTADGTVASLVNKLHHAVSAIEDLDEQIGQMEGMYDDEDGTIESARSNAESVVKAVKSTLSELNRSTFEASPHVYVTVVGGVVQSVEGTGLAVGQRFTIIDHDDDEEGQGPSEATGFVQQRS